ncbi:hypothetical protein FRC06_009373 [Ceratobasidium sp. 370]|nr:hypothetical protein FRC06_009373 [Ceratobasidium sp. 370]
MQLDIYESHLKGLLAYKKKAPVRLAKFRDDWFWYGVDRASSSDHDEPYQAITVADQIRPDTLTSDIDTQACAEGKAQAID